MYTFFNLKYIAHILDVSLCCTLFKVRVRTIKWWHLHFIRSKELKPLSEVVHKSKNSKWVWKIVVWEEAKGETKKKLRNSWNSDEKRQNVFEKEKEFNNNKKKRTHTMYKSFANYKCLHFHCNKWRYQLDVLSSTSTPRVRVQQFLSSLLFPADVLFQTILAYHLNETEESTKTHGCNIAHQKHIVSQKMVIIESVMLCNKNATLPFILLTI